MGDASRKPRIIEQCGEPQPKAFTGEGAEDAEEAKVVDVYWIWRRGAPKKFSFVT